jgi:hypothetical protein
MTIKVQPVPHEMIHHVWAKVEPFIQRAYEKFGSVEYTVDQIKVYLTEGMWLLMVATDENNDIKGAATASFINYPSDRVAFITSIGGKLVTNPDTFNQMCHILKVNGATKIQGFAKEAVARLWKKFGFEDKAILVEVKL